jgi:hypothetical protein
MSGMDMSDEDMSDDFDYESGDEVEEPEEASQTPVPSRAYRVITSSSLQKIQVLTAVTADSARTF